MAKSRSNSPVDSLKTCRTISFGTKGETLFALKELLRSAIVPEFALITQREWLENREPLLATLEARFSGQLVICRSSAQGEDSARQSHAGEFESVANVLVNDRSVLVSGIERVFHSYRRARPNLVDQVIVQRQVQRIRLAGVAFSRDLDTGAPYITVNFDESGSHDSVTSGRGHATKTFVAFRGGAPSGLSTPPWYQSLRSLISELEEHLQHDALDLEFAIDTAGQLHLLQVRPLTGGLARCECTDAQFGHYLDKIFKKTLKLSGAHPGLCGQRGMYSVMTDWNPAEMIGIRPTALALSLYKYLITDETWAYQRHNYGYRNLRSFPLLISFLGLPYIDVRVSANSFIPADLDERISAKLADYYMDTLAEHPANHDKVEFKVVFSCYDLSTRARVATLKARGFSELECDRIIFSLIGLTNRILNPAQPLYAQDLARLELLPRRYQEITASSISPLEKIYWLTHDCARYGVLPFAGLARAGFIAMQMLRSLVETGVLQADESQAFLNSLNTIARQLADDSAAFHTGKCTKDYICEKYGHLRPGTYDILSPRYDVAFETYFGGGPSVPLVDTHRCSEWRLSAQRERELSALLREHGLSLDSAQLFSFLKIAIEGRELGKFMFTRNVSAILELLAEIGSRHGISREDMSHVDIHTILSMYSQLTHEDVGDILRRDVEVNKRAHAVSRLIRLPQLITEPNQVYEFYLSEVEPNFITQGKITEIIVLEEMLEETDPSGKIVFIRSADPGYDWLFSRNIAGLVTMYGGANSHMAIRCAELGIPAVIGCGEENFARWRAAHRLSIDCSNRTVELS